MTAKEAIEAIRRGERVGGDFSIHKTAGVRCKGWNCSLRTIFCDGKTDVVECAKCGMQSLAECNFYEVCVMQSHVRVCLDEPDARWRHGVLVMDRSEAVLICRNRITPPEAVDCVQVYSNCPIELLDAAVDSGYYVLGQPRAHA